VIALWASGRISSVPASVASLRSSYRGVNGRRTHFPASMTSSRVTSYRSGRPSWKARVEPAPVTLDRDHRGAGLVPFLFASGPGA